MAAGDLLNYSIKQPGQPLSEALARNLLKQICAGVKGLHANDIIHRDLKLENILMSDFKETATARIADFGSATKLSSPDAKINFCIGTPGYTAPEIIQGLPYGKTVDVWSIGCLMHVLLTA